MKLSIIVVHHCTPELLKLCLKSVKDFVPQNIIYETIVVDSASTRETRNVVLEHFPFAKLIASKENLGYAKGVNIGIMASKGDYILILNPDIILTPDAAGNMIQYMTQNPAIGLLGPILLDFKGDIQHSYFQFYNPLTVVLRRTFLGKMPWFKKQLDNFLMADTDPLKPQEPDWLQGSALMTARKAVEKVGLMDERYFLYFEDVDWARRFWDNGFTVVYYPEAKMFHYHQRRSSAGFDIFDFFLRKETRWHIMSALKYFLRYGFFRNRNIRAHAAHSKV